MADGAHIPTKAAMACHSLEAVRLAVGECRAFTTLERRTSLQGSSCDGCTRTPASFTQVAP